MTDWKEIAPRLGLDHGSDETSPMGQGVMTGERDGHHVRVFEVNELRRTARTKIVLTFGEPLRLGLSISSSAADRAQGSWLWLVFAGLFFVGGIGGAIAACHGGPLVVCVGGALLMWGWVASRRSAKKKREGSIPTGDERLDRLVAVKADDRPRAAKLISDSGVRELIVLLAKGDRELKITDGRISVDINRVVKTAEEFEAELKRMTGLAAVMRNKKSIGRDIGRGAVKPPSAPIQ